MSLMSLIKHAKLLLRNFLDLSPAKSDVTSCSLCHLKLQFTNLRQMSRLRNKLINTNKLKGNTL